MRCMYDRAPQCPRTEVPEAAGGQLPAVAVLVYGGYVGPTADFSRRGCRVGRVSRWGRLGVRIQLA